MKNDKTAMNGKLLEPVVENLAPADYIEITALLNSVYLAEDNRNGEALRSLVTRDFVQEHAIFGTVKSAEEFSNWVLDNPKLFDGLRHHALNVVLKPLAKDTVEGISYILVAQLFAEPSAEGLPRIIGHGVVHDHFNKTAQGWRLAKRVYDQFALSSSYVPDAEIRSKAARSILG